MQQNLSMCSLKITDHLMNKNYSSNMIRNTERKMFWFWKVVLKEMIAHYVHK